MLMYRFFIVLLSFGMIQLATAQLDFLPPHIPEKGGTPLEFAWGDFDANGKTDFAFASDNDPEISVFYNSGSNVYSEKKFNVGIVGIGIRPMTSGDLNKDGKTDLVIYNDLNSSSQQVIVLISTGQSFNTLPISPQAPFSISKKISILDFDLDGNMDILCATDSQGITFYKGNGSTVFQLTPLNITGAILDFRVADINKDGKSDIVVMPYSNEIHTYTASTGGSFTQKSYPILNQGRDLEVAYLNNDMYPDIIVTPGIQKQLSYFINDQTGNFNHTQITVSNNLKGPIAIADHNSDGLNDILLAVDNFDHFTLLKNQNGTSFIEEFITGVNTHVEYLEWFDFEGDSKPEIVSLLWSKSVDIYTQNSLVYSKTNEVRFGIHPVEGTYADFNKDGFKDLVVSHYAGNSISILYGDVSNSFKQRKDFSFPFDIRTIGVTELNSDGFPDIIYGSDFNGSNRGTGIILSNGNGSFHSKMNLTANPTYILHACDLNQDGKNDIITDNTIYYGNGIGTFTASSFSAGITPYGPSLAVDLNGDEYIDLLLTDNQAAFRIAYNDGTGHFPSFQSVSTLTTHNSLSTFVDASNKLNIISSNWGATVNILTRQPGNTFTEQVLTLEGKQITTALAADLDKDSKMDIVTASTNKIDILSMNQANAFVLVKTISLTNTTGYDLLAADINNDDKEDITQLSLNGTSLIFLLNDVVFEPTSAPNNLAITNVTDKVVSISFNIGNGSGRMVVIRPSDKTSVTPVDQTFYSDNTTFGLGAQIGSSNFVLKKGDVATAEAIGLTEGTSYTIDLYEYNINKVGTIINYLPTGGSISFTTKKNQIITPGSISSKLVSGGTFTITPTSSSGLPVSVAIVEGAATSNNLNITPIGPGPVKLRLSQSGNSEFLPAPDELTSFCIDPEQPSISVTTIQEGNYILTSSSDINNTWLKDDIVIPNAVDNMYQAEGGGVYKVKVDYSGCSNTSQATTYLIMDVNNGSALGKPFPNPTSGILIINLANIKPKEVTLHDSMGRSIECSYELTGRSLEFDLRHQDSGVYVIKLWTEESWTIFKVIKI